MAESPAGDAHAEVRAPLPRVLLVDDDPTIRLLVTLALEALPIELLCAASVAEAQPLLRGPPLRLVICDLMMPGVSGLTLLQQLAADPALRRGARLVPFSAGLDAGTRQRLDALGVWRMLAKPVSMNELENCVLDAVRDDDGAASAAACVTPASPEAIDETGAIAQHFGGDAALFAAFRDSCRVQFVLDVADTDSAWAAADAAALRRQMHSLKSVLATLGQAGAAQLAREAEQAAAAQDWAAWAAAWVMLRAWLLRPAASDD
jgi:CheY-like chemotaxis protein